MTADATPDRESRSSDEIFRLLSVEFSRNVVTRALQHRAAATGVRKQLNTRVRHLQLDGFRDASRAPHQRLLRPILDAIERGDHPLARAVLNTWMDSHEALRNAASAHLADRGIPAPEPPDACFESSWTTDEWLRERHALTADGGALDADDAGLMLCLVSRRFPAPPPLESPYFSGWIDELFLLPPDAPEWAEVDAFTKWVRDVRRAKHRELFRWRTDAIAHICDDIRTRFDEDLRYLDVDPDPWANTVRERPRLADPAHALVVALRDALEAYQPVRPQAASRDEELQRSEARRLREDDILGLVAEWEELTAQPGPAEKPAPEADAEGDQPAADPAGTADEDQHRRRTRHAGQRQEPSTPAGHVQSGSVLDRWPTFSEIRFRTGDATRGTHEKLSCKTLHVNNLCGYLHGHVVYTPAGRDFFCVEPATNCIDGFNLADAGRTDTGTIVLAPGDTAAGDVTFTPEVS